MNKVVRMLEAEMKMDQVLKGFMVELEIDNKKFQSGWTSSRHVPKTGSSRVFTQALE